MMKRRRLLFCATICIQLLFLLPASSINTHEDNLELSDSLQARLLPQHNFKNLPSGNYSGMAYLGNDTYAVVSDKTDQAGFYIFHITLKDNGDIDNITNRGFISIPGQNLDEEAIAYNPSNNHLYIGNEANSQIMDYDMNLHKIVNLHTISDYNLRCRFNRGIESLTYDPVRNKLFTINESPYLGDNGLLLRVKQLNLNLEEEKEFSYIADEPLESIDKPDDRHAYGVAELLALSDGSILALERELYIRPLKLNSWVMNKIFRFKPGNPHKQFVIGWRTWLHLSQFDFADYEGMCEGPRLKDGRHVILLCADSQNRYKGVLKDFFRTIVF